MKKILQEIEIRYTPTGIKSKESITSSKDAYCLFLNHWNQNLIELQEEFHILFLSRANKVKGVYKLSKGGVTGTVVDNKLVFGVALKTGATSLILAHNHPSGNLKPSLADIDITKKIKKAGELLEIKLLDHLIITMEGYYSFADEGNL